MGFGDMVPCCGLWTSEFQEWEFFYEDSGFLETVYFINTVYKKKIQPEQRTSVHKIRVTQTAGYSVELFTRVVAAELNATDGERRDIYACFNHWLKIKMNRATMTSPSGLQNPFF